MGFDCQRETDITDWNSIQDAIQAWQDCGCLGCTDALEELDRDMITDANQQTL